jgi:hypothetical protein
VPLLIGRGFIEHSVVGRPQGAPSSGKAGLAWVVVDLMLARSLKDKVESAYNRAAFMPRRYAIARRYS